MRYFIFNVLHYDLFIILMTNHLTQKVIGAPYIRQGSHLSSDAGIVMANRTISPILSTTTK